MPTLPPYACLPQVGLSYYRHGKCSGGGGGLPPWVPPHFVWERGTASGAFGPLGGILGQKATKKNNFGPKLLGQLFGPAVPPRGGTQWCPVVQLGAGECGAGGLWVTFTSLPQAVVVGGWSQNLIKAEGPQIHFVVRTKDK